MGLLSPNDALIIVILVTYRWKFAFNPFERFLCVCCIAKVKTISLATKNDR